MNKDAKRYFLAVLIAFLYFGLLFSRLKYAQAQDMRNEQRRVYREMKTVAERANYSEYNESNQLMESVDILHRVFGY